MWASDLQQKGRQKSVRRQLVVMILVMTGIVAMGVTYCWGQGGRGLGSMAGTVTDPTGGLVPGAKVSIANTGTGHLTESLTVQDGTFIVPILPAGVYSVTATKDGFTTVKQTGIVIAPDQVARIDITMQVGKTTTAVEVAGHAEMITTTDAAIGQLINATTVAELPLNGRNPGTLVYLAPAAIDGHASDNFIFQQGFANASGASVSGSREGTVLYQLNGATNMNPFHMEAAPFPNPEATQEFQVVTNNFGAQYGFASGSVVSIVTRSGTNQWHGNLFEFVRNRDLNAKSYFGKEKDPLHRNQFGGSLGGKIIKDKLFVFGNYQETIQNTVSFSQTAYVPTNAMLKGDFSVLLPGTQLYDQNGNAYPNNYIDPTTFNPISVKIEESMPHTDNALGFINVPGVSGNDRYYEGTIKVDYNPGSKDRISVSAFVDQYTKPGATGNGDILLMVPTLAERYQAYGVNYVRNLSTNLINSFVFGYARSPRNTIGGMTGADGKPADFTDYGMQIGLAPSSLGPPGFGSISYLEGNIPFTGSGNSSLIPMYMFNIDDTVSWVKGKHLLMFGVDIVREDMSILGNASALPGATFDGGYTGYGISDFLTGRMFQFSMGAGQAGEVRGTSHAFFVSDQFRFKPNFTVTAGLRWEPFYPPTVLGGRQTLFRRGEQSTRYPNAPVGLVFPGDPGVPAASFPGEPGQLLPRLGIAWQPKALPNTSIRAAFGLFAPQMSYSDYANVSLGAPFSPLYNLIGGPGRDQFLSFTAPFSNNPGTNNISPFPSLIPWAPGNPPASTLFYPPVGIYESWAPGFKLAKIQSWNFSVEHQVGTNFFVRAAYVGSEAYHLEEQIDQNPGIYSAGGARTRYPNFNYIDNNESVGTASYNGLELTTEKRFSHGFQFTSNFTYSKSLDESTISTSAYRGGAGINPFQNQWSRGPSDFDFRYIWSTQGIYRLPRLAQYNRFVRGGLGSWEVSAIWTLHPGEHFFINGGNGNNNSLAGAGADRADVTGQPFNEHQGSKSQWIQQYLNPAAFRTNAPGTWGNSERNGFTNPRANNVDLGIMKNIPYKERYALQLRLEMFNAFNYVQLGTHWYASEVTVGSPNFGTLSNQLNANRVMQIAGKFSF